MHGCVRVLCVHASIQICLGHNLYICPWISELEQVPSGARIPPASAISCCIKNIKSLIYRSLWPTFSLRSNSGQIYSFIPNFHVALKVQGKITGSRNIYQRDILLL